MRIEDGCGAWELARDLVRIDSSNPGAHEANIESFIKDWLGRRIEGLPDALREHARIDELEVLPGRPELMVSLDGHGESMAEPRLVLICHMDTVGLGTGWDEEGGVTPLGGLVREGRLYGRGACDMKSGLACALSCFAHCLERTADLGSLPRRAVSLICTADEEAQMRGIEAAIDAGWVGADDWALDCEPTDAQIQVAHKGRLWLEIEVQGVTAHASQPWEGADAIAAMAEVISHIRRSVAAQPAHTELGRPTVSFGQIEGGYQPYVVSDHARTWADLRLVPPLTSKRACAIADEAIATAEREVPGTHGSYIVGGDRPAIERDPASPLLAALRAATEHALGAPAEIGVFTGYTDTAVVAARTHNNNCMSYGPGSLALAHKPNEYVEQADVRRVEAVLIELAEQLLW